MRNFLAILMMCAALVAEAATPSASTVLKKVSDTLRAMPSASATFTISGQNGQESAQLWVCANSFKMDVKNHLVTYFDGHTQWVYDPSAQEISITEPTAEALAMVNPLAMLTSLQNSYKSRLLKGATGKYVLELVPKTKGGDLTKAVVTVNATTYHPEKALLYLTNGSTATITIKSITKQQRLPASHFKPTKAQYPKAEWIDLR
ncbi:MAG: outer-membrane lipoprotein carrier protein LolA [Bacteroidales bacterium]|nr:outer-membrane lipoprotein carrier protein LolA [Bacteroidales bacterium]MCD8395468.1 outer-membrane lipoprotein carrier protein LolA [Bacteroidales bacterium]